MTGKRIHAVLSLLGVVRRNTILYHKKKISHLEGIASGKFITMTKITTVITPQFLAQYTTICSLGVIQQYQQFLHHCISHVSPQTHSASARIRY